MEANLRAWRDEGVDLVVSLLEWTECGGLDLGEEGEICQRLGMGFRSYPICDHGVPAAFDSLRGFLTDIEQSLAARKSVVVHCLAGIGRSGLTASCLLLATGIPPDLAMRHVSVARGLMVPETSEQKEWVAEFARLYPAST